jgi:acyl-CoA reductase-like NAD-dependent aldehyde dehydrogenase
MGHVNDISVADSEYAACGGEKNSGIGRFNAEWIIDEFTRPHWITTQGKAPVGRFERYRCDGLAEFFRLRCV